MALPTAPRSPAGRLAEALASLAAAILILGVAALPFMTPAWIHVEQDRAGAQALTGYSADDLRQATDGILHDLFLGGGFDVLVSRSTVLDPAERAHMRDVRGAFAGFGVLVLVAVAFLVVIARGWRAGAARARLWAAIRRGTASLAVLLVALGVIALVAFDAAFEVFHQILFPGGNFNFDPATEKLVQLFPEQFWSETALAYGAVALVLALVVGWQAGRRAEGRASEPLTGAVPAGSPRASGRMAP